MNVFLVADNNQNDLISNTLLSKFNAKTSILAPLDQLNFNDYDVIINIKPTATEFLSDYLELEGKIVIVGVVNKTLAQAVANTSKKVKCKLFAINSIPYFLKTNALELSSLSENNNLELSSFLNSLSIPHKIVQDSVGMVSARVISMIINEAFFTLSESTASISDINKGMKLGTNYPYGPFEWLDLIGINNVYGILNGLFQFYGSEKYKIAPNLKKLYFNSLIETKSL